MVSLKLIITGIVQGVGFRPFIHRIALESGVKGYVRNIGGAEVEVFIEGSSDSIRKFFILLYSKTPPPAFLEEVEVYEVESQGLKDFRILKSEKTSVKKSMIPPDFGICECCLREILDRNDRRYKYPFNSCAWCGPRFSMMYKVPYDRENTSMKKYVLCSKCFDEYNDVSNVRRYHAQGISCSFDGPRLWLTDNNGNKIDVDDPIRYAAKLIDEGFILAVKGLGGYHLAALATDDDVVKKLRLRKNRPRKPFAIMALNLRIAEKLAYISEDAKKILLSPQRPIVLLPKKEDSPVSKLVSPGMFFEGIFIPYTGLHYLLLMETRDKFLIMTSGNPKGQPMCIDEKCAFKKLSKIADYFLIHDREIVNRVDDSVVRFTDNHPVLLRRSRGYAPLWIKLPDKLETNVIAFGADLHNVAAIAFDDKAVLTQYIGDLDDVNTINDLMKYINFFISNYNLDLHNSIVVVDKHPLYNSRRLGLYFAKKHGVKSVVEVQHHFAHILATAIDHGISGEKFVGIALDGTGYGDDGCIWGGEVFVISKDGYRRVGHLEYQPIDSERTITYPIRFFISVLSKIFSWNEVLGIINRFKLNSLVPHGLKELKLLYNVIKNDRFTPTSSTGRFLDGVSAFLKICTHKSYEGEPAIVLESHALKGRYLGTDYFYPKIEARNNMFVVNTTNVYLELIENYGRFNPRDIAYTIQYNLGRSLGELVVKVMKSENISSNVVLGGGATVNTIIVKGLREYLLDEDINVVLPKRVPCNDGGIALGQIASLIYRNTYT